MTDLSHLLETIDGLSRVEIDAEALAGNVRAIKSLVGENVTVMAVVKSDGYGHGAIATARTALLNGATYLGVSSLREAIELRNAGITAPLLTFNYTPASMVSTAMQQDIALTLYDLAVAHDYNRIAQTIGKPARVHVKIDTGMGRMGIKPEDAPPFCQQLSTLTHIEVEGVFTHFSVADGDPDYTAEQLHLFKDVLRTLTGFRFKYIHAANSAATIAHPETHFTMVRVGIALYGLHPSDQVRLPEGFRPALAWKTTIVQVKTLPPGHAIGYGNTYKTNGIEKIAVLPVGYADGFRRAPQNWGAVLVRGQRAPLVGRVSMEKTTIQVSHIPDVTIGDEVVLLGRQGNEVITAEEIANRLGTINYEVVCGISSRIPRHLLSK